MRYFAPESFALETITDNCVCKYVLTMFDFYIYYIPDNYYILFYCVNKCLQSFNIYFILF